MSVQSFSLFLDMGYALVEEVGMTPNSGCLAPNLLQGLLLLLNFPEH